MIKLSSQKAINTKIKSINSDFITNEHLNTVLNLPNFKEAIAYVVNIFNFSDPNYNNYNLSDIEFLISNRRLEFLDQIKHYLTIDSLKIYNAFRIKYINDDIKMLINVILKNITLDETKKYLHVLGKNNSALPNTNNFSEFIEYFKDTDYYKILKLFEHKDLQGISFALDISLDNYYYKKILSTLDYVDSTGKNNSVRIFKNRLDFLNLEWIYRGKKYYKLIPEEMINYCNLKGNFTYMQIKEFCYMSFDDYLLYLNKNYPYLLKNGIEYVWVNTGKLLFNMASHIVMQNPNDELLINALIFLLEFKIKDLYLVLESKRLDFTTDEIKKMLITLN